MLGGSSLAALDGRSLDLDYFVEWRPYLWRRPLVEALTFLGDLRGKRVLEIGGRSGRIASLLALLGAQVTMLQQGSVSEAANEVGKWGVSDRVQLFATDGGFDCIAGEKFDVLFTKSLLWCIKDLAGFLTVLESHLSPGGKIAFVENVRGGALSFWLRRHVFHRGDFGYGEDYHGITTAQLAIFRQRFAEVRIKRHRLFVYGIQGQKQSAQVSSGLHAAD